MKSLTMLWTLIIGALFVSSQALGNPAMLPKHPGYPMSAAKDPVQGVPVANDPGQTPLPAEEALKAAAEFDNTRVINPLRDQQPNIQHEEPRKPRGSSASSNS